MFGTNRLHGPEAFSLALYEAMKRLNAGIGELAFYEFRYALENVLPEKGWESVELEKQEEVQRLIRHRDFYASIQLKPRVGDKIVLDGKILQLTQMLFAGLVTGHQEGRQHVASLSEDCNRYRSELQCGQLLSVRRF